MVGKGQSLILKCVATWQILKDYLEVDLCQISVFNQQRYGGFYLLINIEGTCLLKTDDNIKISDVLYWHMINFRLDITS